MKLTSAALLARLEAGASPDELMEELRSPSEGELLMRCRLARRFDRPLFQSILAVGLPGNGTVDFEAFVQHPAVEPLARPPGWYYARPAGTHRPPALQQRLPPEEERRLHHQLADYFADLGAEADLDVLHHLLGYDPDAARALYERLFQEADRRGDLTRCTNVLDVLEAQRRYLSNELGRLHTDHRLYIGARSDWEAAYFSTSRYFSRDAVHAVFEGLLRDPDRWVLQLYGTGGMGKTMFIRWAIARYCVPEPNRTPVARVDFDLADHVEAARRPWQLLATFAEQLNRQLPNAPFTEMLAEVYEYRHTSSGQGSIYGEQISGSPRYTQQAAGGGDLYGEKLAEQIPDRFGSELAYARGVRPVVLILDTLEEALLRYQADLPGLMDTFSRVKAACPGLRIILSGRYDLRERYPNLAARLDDIAVHHAFTRFTDEEAEQYLVHTRRLSRRRPIDTVIKRAEGLPFKLALFADILQSEPGLTAEAIEAYPSVDLLYLIERIIERIEDQQVHWLLRYGVIPRRLTFPFLTEVMGRYLPTAMAGEQHFDDAAAGLPEKKGGLFRTDLLPSSDTPVDYSVAWERLKRYASDYSWVSRVPDADDTLVFHGDVIAPMRMLVRSQPVYALLHRDAVDYFEGRAKADPAGWARWAVEAIYHRFQLEGAVAVPYWNDWAARALETDDPGVIKAIAAEVVGPEYLDDDGEPRFWRGSVPMLDEATLVNAFYLLASSNVRLALRAKGSAERYQLMREARTVFDKAAARPPVEAGLLLTPAQRTSIHITLLLQEQNNESALALIDETLPTLEAGPERLRLLDQKADLLIATHAYQEASNVLEEATRQARTLGDEELTFRFEQKWMRTCLTCGRLTRAVAIGEGVLARRTDREPDRIEPFIQLLVHAHLACGEPSRAFTVAREAATRRGTTSVHQAVEYQFLMARAELERRHPQGALACCEQGLTLIAEHEQRLGPAVKMSEAWYALHPQGLELRGRIRAALMHYEQAFSDLENARHAFSDQGDADAALGCLLQSIRIQLFDVGDLSWAESLITQAEQFGSSLDSASRADVVRSRAALLCRMGEETRARSLLDAELNEAPGSRPGFVRARLALEGMMLPEQPEPARYASFLAAALGELDHPIGRLLLLRELERPGRSRPFPEAAAGVILRTADEALDALGTLQGWDELQGRTIAAAAYRAGGAHEKARIQLERVCEGLSNFREPSLPTWVAVLAEAERLGGEEIPEGRQRSHLIEALSGATDSDILAGRCLALLASQEAEAATPEAARPLYERAVQVLGSGTIVTRWPADAQAAWARHLEHAGRPGAAGHAEAALRIYQRLNDRLQARELEQWMARLTPPAAAVEPVSYAQTAPPPAAPRGIEPDPRMPDRRILQEVTLGWDPQAASIQINRDFATPGGPRKPGRAVPIEASVRNAVVSEGRVPRALAQKDTTAFFAYALLDAALEDWPPLARELWNLLDGGEAILEAIHPDAGLALHTEPSWPTLAALPWELAIAHANAGATLPAFYRSGPVEVQRFQRLARVQEALNRTVNAGLYTDGIMGPQTAHWLAVFQRDAGLPDSGTLDVDTRRHLRNALRERHPMPERPKVLVLRSRWDTQHLQRNTTTIAGDEIVHRYLGAGFAPYVIDERHAETLEKDLTGPDPPWIIHLAASLRESRSLGAIQLYFEQHNPKVAYEGREQHGWITAMMLDRMLKSAPPGPFKPLVIIDVPRPPGPKELVRQLFLRNIFTTELGTYGTFPSVLATGLVHPYRRAAFETSLVQHLRGGAPLFHLPQVFLAENGMPGERLEDLIGPASTILFTADPFMG